jgi:hypothetical protein
MGTFEKHLAAVRAGEITKSNVIGIRKALNAYERKARRYSNGCTAPDWTGQEVNLIEHTIDLHKPLVTGELHTGGLALLRSPRYRKRLEKVAGIIAALDHFRLVRFDYIGNSGLHRTPVYQAIARDGRRFTFRNIPWQSAFAMGLESGPTIEPEQV